MNFFTINVLLFSLVIMCNSASDKNSIPKSKTKMLHLKTDVDKVGEDLENLAFDIVEQVMAKVNMFQVYEDYDTEDEVETPMETTTQNGTTKNSPGNLENTTEQYTTDKSVQISATILESSATTPKSVLEHYSDDFSKKRSKRSVSDVSNKVQVPNDQSGCDNSKCPEKTLKEQVLEHQQIEDLKEEVDKLYDLVLLLRDQQKVMSLLGEDTRHNENDLPKTFNARDLLKVLDHVSNKDARRDKNSSSERKSAEIIIESDAASKKATHEELEIIKNDLRTAIQALNKTKTMLTMQREKETVLEHQLNDQKIQINFLRAMILRLYKGNGTHSLESLPKKENLTILRDETLGTALHLPKELPLARMDRRKLDKTNETTRDSHSTDQISRTSEITRESKSADQDQEKQHRAKGRASEFDDLEALLDQISKPKKSDIESRMLELQKEMEKKKHDEDLLNQLILLQKLAAKQKESKDLHSSDSELIKKLQMATGNMNKPESKLVDDDVELELKKLQDAINNLRPKDQWEMLQDDRWQDRRTDTERIQQMLEKLLSNAGHKGHRLSPKEIEQLENPKILGGESTEIHFPGDGSFSSNGYGYGPPGIFRRGPPFPTQVTNRWYGNVPFYPPFANQQYPPMMNRMLNNNYGMYGAPGNAEYSGYFPPTSNIPPNPYQDPNFGPYPYYKPMSMEPNHNFEANMDLNTYGSPNFKPFGNPLGPVPHGYGTGMEQNSFQTSSDIYSTGQHNFGMSTDQNMYQIPSDGYHKPYVPSQASNQYNFGANMDQSNYQSAPDQHGPSTYNKPLEQGTKAPYSEGSKNSQNYKQTEIRNQFFPVYQPNVFQKTMANAFYSQANAAGEGSGQSGAYSSHDKANVDYRRQKIEDLKSHIYSLQNIIDNLNKPDYTQKPEDKATVANLERQITELNGVINGLNQDMAPSKPNYLPSNPQIYEQNNPQQLPTNYEKPSRRRRSIEANEIDSDDDSKLYDQVVSKVRQFFFEKDNQTEERSSYDDVQRRIADLKYRLENHMGVPSTGPERTYNPVYPSYGIQNTYQPPYYQYNHYQSLPSNIITKKNDVFTSIVLKILDKVFAATPAVIEKLFGAGLTKLTNFGDDYSYGDNYGGYNVGYGTSNDIEKLFKGLGFLGYGPLIFLKLIDGFTTFMRILKKNAFFKSFLIPALILLLVAGSVLFLVWWLQPNDDYYGYSHSSHQPGYDYPNKNSVQYSNDNYQGNNFYGPGRSYNTPAYSRSYNPPVYSRSYFDDGQRNNFM